MEDKQTNNNETIILGEYTETNAENKESKPKKDNFFKTHKNAVLISTCVALSALGAFGGTMLAIHVNGGMGKAVLYQSVDTSKNKNSNATATNVSITDIANKTMDSVVEIKTEAVSTHSFFQQAIVSGAGSGVILSKDGYIVTNHHVIDGASKITVTTRSGKSYEAKLIGSDSATDLAVLKIEAEDLQPAVLGDSSKLNVGDTAVAIGNPLGSLGGTVTSGIISALDREVTIDNQKNATIADKRCHQPGQFRWRSVQCKRGADRNR